MTKADQVRLQAWRFRLLQWAAGTGNVSRTCRHFGLSRKTFYKWKARFDADGQAALGDRSHAARRFPRATPPDVVSKILYLRQRYHFGPGKIGDYLHRFHAVTIATATVHRVLQKHGMNRLPANQKYRRPHQRWQRYEKPQPGHRLQLDVKFLERIPGTQKRFYQFTAIDDCTRIRVLKVYDACNQRAAMQFIDEVRRRLPFRLHVVQTDNGAEFQSAFTGTSSDWTFATSISGRGRRTSMARSNAPTVSMTRSSISYSTRTASATTFTYSMRSCANGRTITITTGRMGPWTDKPRTSGSWPKRALACHRRRENVQTSTGSRRRRSWRIP